MQRVSIACCYLGDVREKRSTEGEIFDLANEIHVIWIKLNYEYNLFVFD